MNNTTDNLKEAFAVECQTLQKYLAFAKKAEAEGWPNIATIFRTAAEAERIHATGHLEALDGVGSTIENLQAAIAGEIYEGTQMYPPMLKQAEAEDHKAKRMFGYAAKAEAVHARMYQFALATLQNGKDVSYDQIYLCPVCGDMEFGDHPDTCPVCRTKEAGYTQVR
jgi:rubrerythrin